MEGFNPSIGLTSVPATSATRASASGEFVSIPQSGLQAFRRVASSFVIQSDLGFQSLNRAYKRSDRRSCPGLIGELRCFNPSIGLTSFPTGFSLLSQTFALVFQSLNRAYKRSDPG